MMEQRLGYIRQMPALPRVVVSCVCFYSLRLFTYPSTFYFVKIFLSVHMLPIAYVPAEDAYAVTKVRSIQGIYIRDSVNPVPPVIQQDFSCRLLRRNLSPGLSR